MILDLDETLSTGTFVQKPDVLLQITGGRFGLAKNNLLEKITYFLTWQQNLHFYCWLTLVWYTISWKKLTPKCELNSNHGLILLFNLYWKVYLYLYFSFRLISLNISNIIAVDLMVQEISIKYRFDLILYIIIYRTLKKVEDFDAILFHQRSLDWNDLPKKRNRKQRYFVK